ncbi:hypothetical protein GUITHDRAFT_146693 [Guillardia theta CCMP2712]|uniref:Diacylglycerol glucosyltransferase N-terminal domain-containing protein n=1 Tax=Guillardia theta (strain CCMP2712) TaxID=905079 RepID=L1IGI0_GUITC|nr:hypothetical protein GUITHDRAFT_146693 [Guillardia theta CCMP2712]EKX35197.1 hypothetical protein GUITHDRAFT_146693 [Guillardia theta CCMP2712]|eukprot:XP_005822177.1 hypothetical protein GUITHDRAFT_146693 [Guillardia theta CCMP2712]
MIHTIKTEVLEEVGHFNNYMKRVWRHISLDLQEMKNGAPKSKKSDGVEEATAHGEHQDAGADKKREAPRRKKILIMMSDTGGGHRASANSLKAALHLMMPEDQLEVKIVDVLEDYTLWFSNRLYNWWVAYPHVWANIFHHTKRTSEKVDRTGGYAGGTTAKILEPTVRSGYRRCLAAEMPDLVVSVHPIMQVIPLEHFMKVANPAKPQDRSKRIPFVTCVTDLGEAHPWWFNVSVDKVFVPTEEMYETAITCGMRKEQVQVFGLPLRQGFWHLDGGEEAKQEKRRKLKLEGDAKVVLAIGGGEGMGKLDQIAKSLGRHLAESNVKSHLVIVCGRNQKLRQKLERFKWPKGCELEQDGEERPTQAHEQESRSSQELGEQEGGEKGKGEQEGEEGEQEGGRERVKVRVVGFLDNVEEYMLASSIAEAAACGRPCMVYDFLPGQEEANVDFVLKRGMGGFEPDANKAAQVVLSWLNDQPTLRKLSDASRKANSNPHAAHDIAAAIITLIQVSSSEAPPWADDAGAGARQTS